MKKILVLVMVLMLVGCQEKTDIEYPQRHTYIRVGEQQDYVGYGFYYLEWDFGNVYLKEVFNNGVEVKKGTYKVKDQVTLYTQEDDVVTSDLDLILDRLDTIEKQNEEIFLDIIWEIENVHDEIYWMEDELELLRQYQYSETTKDFTRIEVLNMLDELLYLIIEEFGYDDTSGDWLSYDRESLVICEHNGNEKQSCDNVRNLLEYLEDYKETK